jgi:hypothetical protein
MPVDTETPKTPKTAKAAVADAVPSVFDFAALDTTALAEDGNEMALVHPVTGEELGGYITLAGADSQRFERAQSEAVKLRVRKRQKSMTTGDIKEENIRLLVACVTGWRNIRVDGEDWPCNPVYVKKFFTRFPWAREQALAYIHDLDNYLQD